MTRARATVTRTTRLTPGVTTAATLVMALAAAVTLAVTAPPAGAADWVDAATATTQSLPSYPSTYANHGIRVAPGVNPPTSSWISPAVFVGDGTPRAVFTGPLAVKPSPQGFGVLAPTVSASGDTILGGYADAAALSMGLLGATGFTLTRKDSLSADLTYAAGSSTVGVLTLAEGWAYAQYTAASDQTVPLTLPVSAGVTPVTGGYRIGATTLLVTQGSLSGTSLRLASGQRAWLAAVAPNATSDDIATLVRGAVPLRGTSTSYAAAAGRANTTYTLDTGSAPTVFVAMPAQSDISGTRLATAYPSINGPMPAVTGTTFTTSTPAYDVPLDLDLSTMSATDRNALAALVRSDAARVATIDATDSYFGGKQLTRAVQVYRLARQLGLAAEQASLKTAIVTRLDQWFDPAGCRVRTTSCFAYDSVLKGIVGRQPSFGSDTEFNDHYFHYGYLLYAAGAMALDDPTLTSRWRSVADAVSAEIASPRATATTIPRRSFDDYAGHGWASGVAPFADGNNQESTSAATNAWVGVTLWGRASGNADLATEGQWMFSREAASAVAYWLKPYAIQGFSAPMASLVWGGKKEYATWFSAEPSAKIGIQVLPAAPAQLAYLRSVGETQLGRLTDAALGAGVTGKPLVDWSIALASLVDPARAQAAYAQLTDADIDNGDTRSYLFALLHTSRTTTTPGTASPTPTTTTPTTTTTTPSSTPVPTTPVPTTPTPTTTAPTATTSTTVSPTSPASGSSANDAYSLVPVSAATSMSGVSLAGSRTTPAATGAAVGFLMDFGTSPVADVVLTLSSGAAGGVSGLVQVRVDSATGPVIADAAVGNTGGWDTSRSVPANSASVTGVHPVYVTFASGQPAAYAALWSVQFRRR